ncbi:hypothetical protein DENSPDRAFT_885934 [Dentipellis sp. KUC8613]|nr:hypothetical protein DENSPDRAFT_885934 [Dentipellis sp. KUC8613]
MPSRRAISPTPSRALAVLLLALLLAARSPPFSPLPAPAVAPPSRTLLPRVLSLTITRPPSRTIALSSCAVVLLPSALAPRPRASGAIARRPRSPPSRAPTHTLRPVMHHHAPSLAALVYRRHAIACHRAPLLCHHAPRASTIYYDPPLRRPLGSQVTILRNDVSLRSCASPCCRSVLLCNITPSGTARSRLPPCPVLSCPIVLYGAMLCCIVQSCTPHCLNPCAAICCPWL